MDSVYITKPNILWQHLNYNDESLKPLFDPSFIAQIDAFVFVSHWQYEMFRRYYNVPTQFCHVITNAIEPIPYQRKQEGKIKLIYTSTPWRGLDVLLDVFPLLEGDIELHVYSSTQVYGDGFVKFAGNQYEPLFERCRQTEGVVYHGYATNAEIKKALVEAHILAYPSIFEETCCLAMIEAGAAACRLVTTDLGALPETGGKWALYTPMQSNRDELVKNYTNLLQGAINDYWANQAVLVSQSDYFNRFHSWDVVSEDWMDLIDTLI
jgi:glycosyltransferase involved in cell wall biosynthesis